MTTDLVSYIKKGGHNPAIVLNLIRKGSDVNKILLTTPLHTVVYKNLEEIFYILVQHGAKMDYIYHDNSNYLHVASSSEESPIGIAKFLMEKGGLDVNLQDSDGFTPLYWASVSGNKGIVELLLTHKADPMITSYNEKYPISTASTKEIYWMLRDAMMKIIHTKFYHLGQFLHQMRPGIIVGSKICQYMCQDEDIKIFDYDSCSDSEDTES